ncbi:hypothetical protein C0J45_11333, partial [Silurus meridionalis]
MIEDILKTSPGGEKIASEYPCTKSLSDSRQRAMVKILVAHLTNKHGTRPSQHLKEQYAKGIISLFPNLADPRTKLGYTDQDFRLLFGDATSAKLEKCCANIKPKVIAQSRGLTQTCELQDLIQNAKANEWKTSMHLYSCCILTLTVRPRWLEYVFILSQTGTSIQEHLDGIGESLQPYLLAVGPKKSRIQSWFIIIDQHALPCKASNSLACVDELFKAYFVFGTSYCQQLTNVYSFLQTTVYDLDVEVTKVNPRVAELRARML